MCAPARSRFSVASLGSHGHLTMKFEKESLGVDLQRISLLVFKMQWNLRQNKWVQV